MQTDQRAGGIAKLAADLAMRASEPERREDG
jgi:hypothetical protein